MNTPINGKNYRKEIENFINIEIHRINILFDPQLLVGGFSLIHIIDNKKKEAKILGIRGKLVYKTKNIVIETTTELDKENMESASFKKNANKIKNQILKNKVSIKEFIWEEDNSRVTIIFSDNSQLKAEQLSYDNDQRGYTVYFDNKDHSGYFKTTF